MASKAMSKDDIIRQVYNELERATDYGNTALREIRAKAWDYYLNRKRGDEMAGRSKVQDTSVRDTVHALMAQIMPAYATDNVIRFEPQGQGDDDQAYGESCAVNNLFTEDNQGYQQLSNAVHDALLFRNGVIKVWIEDVEEVEVRRFPAPAAEVLAATDIPDNEEWTTDTDTPEESVFRVKVTTQRLRTHACEQAHLFLDPNQEDQQLQECGFIGELAYLTRSELVEMGVPQATVAELPAITDQSQTSALGGSNIDLLAKMIDGVAQIWGAEAADRQLIECYWVHIKLDTDGDGISEKHRYLVSNRQLLLEDTVEWFPYASGTGWPVPHRWSGLGVYDLQRITQDERTNARRQLADNMNYANNQRPVYDPGMTEIEDVTAGAPGRGIRSKQGANGVSWMPVQDIISNSVQFLQYMDKVRSEQTGASLDMMTGEGQLVREASGISVDLQLAPREMMAALIARNLAETLVRNMFLLIHETLRREWRGDIEYQRSGEWVSTNPGEWRRRTRLNVTVGLSPGERRRQVQALQYVHQIQLQLIQGGAANITTDWDGVHSSLRDWMAAAELDGGEMYFLDPDGKQSQQAQQAAAQQQEQAQQQQAQLAERERAMEDAQAQLEVDKQAFERYKFDQEMQFKYFEAQLKHREEGMKLDQQQRENEQEAAGQAAQAGADTGNGAAATG